MGVVSIRNGRINNDMLVMRILAVRFPASVKIKAVNQLRGGMAAQAIHFLPSAELAGSGTHFAFHRWRAQVQ